MEITVKRSLGFLAGLLLGYSAPAAIQYSNWTSLDSAATYGLYTSTLLSSDYEYGGAILENKINHRFYITRPQTDHNPASLLIDLHVYDSDYVLVGMYHTHPCVNGYDHEHFSIPDTAHSIYNHVPSYIADGCTGRIYKFDPDVDLPDNDHGKTLGRTIGWVTLTITKR